jgi:hypothetical protein
VIFYAGLDRLRRNFERYFGEGSTKSDEEIYLEDPLRTYPEASGAAGAGSRLISLLGQILAEGKEADFTAVAVADHIEAAVRQHVPTGFPE